MSKQNSLLIYGCGGFGVNMVENIINLSSDVTGFPVISYSLIDTSLSNLKNGTSKNCDKPYIIRGVDGSGKNRPYAYKIALPHIDKIILENPPKDFNIVMFSMGGGSGSVIGSLLLAELIKRGHDAVGICVGSYDNAREALNTKNTFASLQHLSSMELKQPLAVGFYNNTADNSRSSVDKRIERDVRALALLVSGNNSELDKTDIGNWLRYHSVTKVTPQLVDLLIYYGDQAPPTDVEIMGIASCSLLPSDNDNALDVGQLYGAVGYLPVAAKDATISSIPAMHFVLTNTLIPVTANKVSDAVSNFDKIEQLLSAGSIPVITGNIEGGMVF